jgi:hypothetical protein
VNASSDPKGESLSNSKRNIAMSAPVRKRLSAACASPACCANPGIARPTPIAQARAAARTGRWTSLMPVSLPTMFAAAALDLQALRDGRSSGAVVE